MNSTNTELLELLKAYNSRFDELLDRLNNEILPAAISKINSDFGSILIAKLEEERLPTNERNLTDYRTRIGILLEYTLALVIDEEWKKALGGAYRLCFVVANQFPDLVARDLYHQPAIRFEVKAIQCSSEEKAANFKTLVRDILPNQDILCVMVWEWEESRRNGVKIQYPHIFKAFALDAYSIAQIRDIVWLKQANMPYKALDVSGHVVPVMEGKGKGASWKGQIKEEEGNIGKLTRLFDAKDLDSDILQPFKEKTSVAQYLELVRLADAMGLQTVSKRLLIRADCPPKTIRVAEDYKIGQSSVIAWGIRKTDGLPIYFVTGGASSLKSVRKDFLPLIPSGHRTRGLMLKISPSFNWYAYELSPGGVSEIGKGKKPIRAEMLLKRYSYSSTSDSEGAMSSTAAAAISEDAESDSGSDS